MREIEKNKSKLREKRNDYSDLLSFEYYNYRLENLANEIKRKSTKNNLKLARNIY